MVIVLIVIIVAVLAIAGVFAVVLRAGGRGAERRDVRGEPKTPPGAVRAPETPTVEELEAMLEAPPAPEPTVVEEPELPELIEKPRLRDRLGRTRAALSTAFRGMRGRTGRGRLGGTRRRRRATSHSGARF